MKEVKTSIWDRQWDGCWKAIPINCQINSKGVLIMGKGLAREAKERYPKLPKEFANLIFGQQRQHQPIFPILRWLDDENVNLMGFPTKRHWKEPADLALIEEGLIFLKGLMPYLMSNGEKEKVVAPRLGCGLGGLNWDRDVKPLVEKYFGDDDNFIIASL